MRAITPGDTLDTFLLFFFGHFMKLKVFSYISVSKHSVISTAQAGPKLVIFPLLPSRLGPQACATTLSSSVRLP